MDPIERAQLNAKLAGYRHTIRQQRFWEEQERKRNQSKPAFYDGYDSDTGRHYIKTSSGSTEAVNTNLTNSGIKAGDRVEHQFGHIDTVPRFEPPISPIEEVGEDPRTIWAVAFLQPAILEGYPPNVTYSQKLWVHSSQSSDAILVEEIPLPNVNGSPDPIHGYFPEYDAYVNTPYVAPTPPYPENYANALCHAFISIDRTGTIYLDRILSKRSSLLIPYPSGQTITNTSRVIIERKHFVIDGGTVTEVPECNSFRAEAIAKERIKFTRSLYTPISQWDFSLPFPYRVWALDPFCNVIQESETRWKVFYFYPESSVGTPGFSSSTLFYPIQGYKTIVWETTGAGSPVDENDPRVQYLASVDGFPKGKLLQEIDSALPPNLPISEIPENNLFTHPFCSPSFFVSEGQGVALNCWPVGYVDVAWSGGQDDSLEFTMPFGQFFVASAAIYSDDDGNETDDDELIGNG